MTSDRGPMYENSGASPELAETPVELPAADDDKLMPSEEQAEINREEDPPA